MTIIAIDPGASGGIAIESDSQKAICFSMPATDGDLVALLREHIHSSGTVVYLENMVKHMGAGIPASTMAVYASNWGFIKAVAQTLGAPLHLVNPKAWQKTLGLGSRVKGSSKTEWKNKLKSEAQRRYPHLQITLKTADALLILSHAKIELNAE